MDSKAKKVINLENVENSTSQMGNLKKIFRARGKKTQRFEGIFGVPPDEPLFSLMELWIRHCTWGIDCCSSPKMEFNSILCNLRCFWSTFSNSEDCFGRQRHHEEVYSQEKPSNVLPKWLFFPIFKSFLRHLRGEEDKFSVLGRSKLLILGKGVSMIERGYRTAVWGKGVSAESLISKIPRNTGYC